MRVTFTRIIAALVGFFTLGTKPPIPHRLLLWIDLLRCLSEDPAEFSSARLRLLRLRPHDPETLQALGRPNGVENVELRNRSGAGRQRHPRLPRGRENVDVGGTKIGVIHGADADEPDGGTGLRVVAPNGDPAGRAAGDHLTLAARRGRRNDLRLTGGVYDTIGFIERVERMRCPGLPLAPTAVAGMNNQRSSGQAISDLPARSSTFHVRLHRGVVAFRLTLGMTDVQFIRA